MSDKTGIGWTEATWNPIAGCSRISEGCRHCYAEREAAQRLASSPKYQGLAVIGPTGDPRWTGEVRLWEKAMDQPLRWKRPRLIFVNSMSDLFHEGVPFEWIDRIFRVMRECPQHTFQILTKRAERMHRYMATTFSKRCAADPLPNVWLGVSAESHTTAKERIPHLLRSPAAIRWVSLEPLLSPIALDMIRIVVTGRSPLVASTLPWLDWIVVGGESGQGARPMGLQWVRNIRTHAQQHEIPFFFKQWGGRTPKAGGRLLDGREWNEYPTTTGVMP